MEMIIDKSKSPDLPGVLGISQERTEQLHEVVYEEYLKIKNDPLVSKPLTDVYHTLAIKCANINEYAFCMHVLIFNLANIGSPRDGAKIDN